MSKAHPLTSADSDSLFPMLTPPPSASWPDELDWHVFQSRRRFFLLLTVGSRIYEVPEEAVPILSAWDPADQERLPLFLAALGIPFTAAPADDPGEPDRVQSFSLAIAQRCNLACTYCFAQGGSFGDTAQNMTSEVAFSAVDTLLAAAPPGTSVNLAFMGGEPLLNRSVLHATTKYAAERASAQGVMVRFAITTNGSAVTPSDCEFFHQYGFSVTVSLDGTAEQHNRLRPFRDGRGTFEPIVARIAPLIELANRKRQIQLSARVTVTPQNLSLRETLKTLIELGFPAVGFSPMLSSPNGSGELQPVGLQEMLAQMIECGRECEAQLAAGRPYPFSNLLSALRELHRGSCRAYSCGAGRGYLGVSASGELSACHRFVNDPLGAMGDLVSGPNSERRIAWLHGRHVDRQEPCRSCWARYLCGGGCHHEVLHRGRPACDYIRGWLDYCLGAYVRMLEVRPDLFQPTPSTAVDLV